MGLTDSIKRIFGGGDTEEASTYECTTCGRQYDSHRTVCVDCSGRVEEVAVA